MVELHQKQNTILISGQVINNFSCYFFLLDHYSGLSGANLFMLWNIKVFPFYNPFVATIFCEGLKVSFLMDAQNAFHVTVSMLSRL
jgi:hypothetical protein